MKKKFVVTHLIEDNDFELLQRNTQDDIVSAKWTINDQINVDVRDNLPSGETDRVVKDNRYSGEADRDNNYDEINLSFDKIYPDSSGDGYSNNDIKSDSYGRNPPSSDLEWSVQRIGSTRQKETILLKKKHHNESATLLHFLNKNLEQLYESIIPVPSLKDLDQKYVVGFTTFMVMLMLSSFFYFFAITFISNLKYENLSIDNNSGACVPVTKSITGNFYGTYYGYWIGYTDYFYSFTFDKLKVTDSEFTSYISNIKEESLQKLEDIATSSPLEYNLLYLMHYEYEYLSQKFKIYSQPNYIFQKDWTASGIASINGSCRTTPTVTYDLIRGQFLLSYDNDYGYYYNEFGEQGFDASECSNITGDNILFVDYNAKKIAISVFTHTATISYNYGINMSSTEPLKSYTLKEYTYENVLFSVFYRQFDNTDKVVCFKYKSGDRTVFTVLLDEYCFIEQMSTLTIPVLNNYGYYSSADRSYYKCYCISPGKVSASDKTNEPVDTYDGCDSFDHILGLIFSPNNDIDVLMKIVTSFTQEEINSKYGYHASRHGLVYSYNYTYPYEGIIYTNGYNSSEDAFSFCDYQCAIIVFENWMSTGKLEINDKFVELSSGACVDIFTSPYFDKLGIDTPTTLTEEYYKCSQSTWQAFINASGIAYSNVGLLFPVFIIVLIPLLYFYLTLARKLPPEETYSHREKLSAVEELGEILLLIRDGDDSNVAKNSAVYALAENILQHVKGETITSSKSGNRNDETKEKCKM